ncbi:hypothetical protein VSR83_36410 [Paraburkholderia unamae]|uniref:Uncharacterized protein n=1 Tax=Paraburkholderia unamae TaxID=219649 RepID=A0ACC6RV81_9BURK
MNDVRAVVKNMAAQDVWNCAHDGVSGTFLDEEVSLFPCNGYDLAGARAAIRMNHSRLAVKTNGSSGPRKILEVQPPEDERKKTEGKDQTDGHSGVSEDKVASVHTWRWRHEGPHTKMDEHECPREEPRPSPRNDTSLEEHHIAHFEESVVDVKHGVSRKCARADGSVHLEMLTLFPVRQGSPKLDPDVSVECHSGHTPYEIPRAWFAYASERAP